MDLITRLKLDNSQYNSGIDSAKAKTKEFQETAGDASKSVEDLGSKGSRSAKEILGEMSKMEGAGRSMTNYRRQLSQMQREIADLTIAYRGMNSEMKNSDVGREVAAKIEELTLKAGQYKDAIQDVQKQIVAISSDTAVWDGMRQGIDTVSSSLQAFVASGVLGEQTTENLVAVLAKLKAIEVSTNAVIKIGNALQKQSALMTGIATLQTKALAVAKNLETKATVGATVAQRIFNAVAKANPYILLATAVIAVVTALYTFTKRTKEDTEAQKKHNEALEAQKKDMEEYRKSIADSVGEVISKYRLLQIQYSKLKTESQRKEWIKQNKNEFENLGLKVDSVTDAENTFIRNTRNVVEALKKRAMAAAQQSRLTELYKRMYEEMERADALYASRKVSAGSEVKASGHDARTGNEYVDRRSGKWVYTEQGAKNANKNIYKQTHGTVQKLQGEIDALADEIAKGLDISGIIKSNTGGSGKVEIPIELGSLQEAQNKVAELQTRLNRMSPDNEKFEETKKQLQEAEKEVERLKKVVAGVKAPEVFPANSLQEANHFIQVFQSQLQEMDPNTEEFEEIVELLGIWKKRAEEILKLMNKSTDAGDDILSKYREIVSEASDISLKVQIGALDEVSANKMIENLNKKLEALGLTAKVKLEVDKNSLKTVSDQLNSFVDGMDKLGSLSNGVSAINSVYEAFYNLGEKLEDAENGWESFIAVFNAGMSVFEATADIISTVATVTDLLTAAKARNAGASLTEATSTEVAATAAATDTGAKISEAAATGAATAAQAGSSVASVPIVGPVLAVAAIIAVMAAILSAVSSAKKFAEGGIVDAPSKIGDKNFIRVNGGEAVLNQRQQANLFKLLNEGRIRNDDHSNLNGNVEFKIRGSELVGVLQNINKKNSKI